MHLNNNSRKEIYKNSHNTNKCINVSIFVSSIVLSVLLGNPGSSFADDKVVKISDDVSYSNNEHKYTKFISELKIDKRYEIFFNTLNKKQKDLVLKFYEEGLSINSGLNKNQKMFFAEHLIVYFIGINKIDKFIKEFDTENIYKEFSFSPVSSMIYKIKQVNPNINLPGEDIDNIIFVIRGITNKNYHHRHKYLEDDKRDMLQSIDSLKNIISEINKIN